MTFNDDRMTLFVTHCAAITRRQKLGRRPTIIHHHYRLNMLTPARAWLAALGEFNIIVMKAFWLVMPSGVCICGTSSKIKGPDQKHQSQFSVLGMLSNFESNCVKLHYIDNTSSSKLPIERHLEKKHCIHQYILNRSIYHNIIQNPSINQYIT